MSSCPPQEEIPEVVQQRRQNGKSPAERRGRSPKRVWRFGVPAAARGGRGDACVASPVGEKNKERERRACLRARCSLTRRHVRGARLSRRARGEEIKLGRITGKTILRQARDNASSRHRRLRVRGEATEGDTRKGLGCKPCREGSAPPAGAGRKMFRPAITATFPFSSRGPSPPPVHHFGGTGMRKGRGPAPDALPRAPLELVIGQRAGSGAYSSPAAPMPGSAGVSCGAKAAADSPQHRG